MSHKHWLSPVGLGRSLGDPIFQGVGVVIGFLALIVAVMELFMPGFMPNREVVPASSPAITPAPASVLGVPLNFWFEVKTEDNGEFSEGIEGKEYSSGEELRFRYVPSEEGYAYLFSLDTAGEFTPLWPDYTSREAAPVKAGVEYSTNLFRLDQSTGKEQFFAVASSVPFSYDEDIKPHLEPEELSGGKGVAPVLKRLNLSEDRFFQKRITFTHTD